MSVEGLHGKLVEDFGSEFTRMLSSAKLVPTQASALWDVPVDHIERVMWGAEAPSAQLESAIQNHVPLLLRDLYAPEVRERITVTDDTNDGVVVCHAGVSDATRRPLYRSVISGVKFSVYDYADTAVSRNSQSMIIPERIWQNLIVEDNFVENMPQWASNQGHFEQQMTYFLGDITTYYKDKTGSIHVENMVAGDMEWHAPFVPHLFTKRSEREALILAVTYRGEVGTRAFLDSIKHMGEGEYLKEVRDMLAQLSFDSLAPNEGGYYVEHNNDTAENVHGVYRVRALLSNVPFQPSTQGLEYSIKGTDSRQLDLCVPAERWGCVVGDVPVVLKWGEYEEILEPNSSFFIKQKVPHAFRVYGTDKGKVIVMQVRPEEEDPWRTLALTLHYTGEEGVLRARRETRQWTK